eukprot:jgi/Mesen1/5209/ME000258S04312
MALSILCSCHMAAARKAYRDLLRTVDRNITRVGGNQRFREHVAVEFRKHAQLASAGGSASAAGEDVSTPTAAEKVQLAADLAFLVSSVHEHRELLLSYNITTDRDVEKAARLKDTAHRVGLEIPTLDFIPPTAPS